MALEIDQRIDASDVGDVAVLDTKDGVGNNGRTASRMAAKTDTEVDGVYTDTHVEWRLMGISGGGDIQRSRAADVKTTEVPRQ